MPIGRNLFIVSIISMLIITGCVPARKWQEADRRANTLQAEADAANARARDAQIALTELQGRNDDLARRINELQRDTAVLGTSLRQMTTQYDKINQLNNELLDKYNKLLAGDRSENQKLVKDLEALRSDLIMKEDSLKSLESRVQEDPGHWPIAKQSWRSFRPMSLRRTRR